METWKIHKFCETASINELRRKKEELAKAIAAGRVTATNAEAILKIVREYIELRELFD